MDNTLFNIYIFFYYCVEFIDDNYKMMRVLLHKM